MLTYKDLMLASDTAICIVNKELKIIECNYSMHLLTGLDTKAIIGESLSKIIYDDELIENIKSPYELCLIKGECLLNTIHQIPLLVKYKVGLVRDENTGEDVYVISFLMKDQNNSNFRKLKAIKGLLESIINDNTEPELMIKNFIKAYNENASVFILDIDSQNNKLISQRAYMFAQIARNKKTVTFCNEESLCFLPIYFQDKVYSIACIKFLIPQLCDEEDIMIIDLAGKILGAYLEIYSIKGTNLSTFRTIFDNIEQPVIIVNEKGIITETNSAANLVYGYCAFDMIGKPFLDLLPADADDYYEDIFNRVLDGKAVYKEKMTHVRSDMSLVNFKVTALPISSTDRKNMSVIFIMQEIDEQKKLQNKIMQWEKLSILGELLYSAANELNNSLTTVIGNAQRLIQSHFTEIQSIAEKIYKSSIRCGSVVNGLLDISRDDDPRKLYSNLNGIIGAALDLKQYQLKANNIDVSVILDENDTSIAADLHDIERLFLHIIDYAERRILEYDRGGSLVIEVRKTDNDTVCIKFSDTGTCIIVDNINHILNQADLSYFSNDEIGIELIAACQILKKIGGKIHIDSQIGKGTAISIELPVSEELPINSFDSKENILFPVIHSEKKVMVVDDEPDIIELLTHFLKQMGFIVDVALDGNEAMEKIGKNSYDLIISDLKMPNGFTGDKLHKFIKYKDPDLAQRMIFMTGDIINHETQKFLFSTGNPYLEKPFLPESLMNIINSMFCPAEPI